MKRARIYLTALIGAAGLIALASAADAQQPGAPPGAPPGQPAPQAGRPAVAVFNMVAVMREYKKAKYQVWQLTEEKKKASAEVSIWKAEYIKLQQETQLPLEPQIKDGKQRRMVELARQIEDKNREAEKKLNTQAEVVISSLYDEIRNVVDKTAEMNGYHIVFAYPDASSPDEMKSAYMKELKLKPPAAQPFFVDKRVDITGVVIQTLNAWYPSPDPPPQAAAQPQQPQGAAAPGR